MSCKVLLITSNLGSVFEEYDIEQKWLSVFNEMIMTSDPDVIALHCQEIGGKGFEITMPKLFEFVKKLQTIPVLAQFDRVRIFMDTDFNNSDHFTALGSMYFIHSRLSSVKIWNFHCDEFQEVTGEVISCQTEGMCQQLSSNEYHRKERFPSEYYPDVKWSRKGFMHTKWNINGNNLDLVNVHLFHDEDNLVALEQSPSCYSQYRCRAVRHTLQRVCSGNDPLFMFGDLNFRLDLTAVVKHVTTQYHQPQFIRGDSGSLEKVIYRNPLAMEEDSLCIERRKFYPNSHATLFVEGFTELLKYDCELGNIKEMKELPITFQPSYPFSEDSTVSNRYMEKRCPAWCDRVLMNDSAMGLVQQSSIQPVYNLMGRDVCTGDHKPVYLLFGLNLSKFDSIPANVSLTTESQQQLQDQ